MGSPLGLAYEVMREFRHGDDIAVLLREGNVLRPMWMRDKCGVKKITIIIKRLYLVQNLYALLGRFSYARQLIVKENILKKKKENKLIFTQYVYRTKKTISFHSSE